MTRGQKIRSAHRGAGETTPGAPAVYNEFQPKERTKPVRDSQLATISNFIWNIADSVLRDLYVRGKYRDVILPHDRQGTDDQARATAPYVPRPPRNRSAN